MDDIYAGDSFRMTNNSLNNTCPNDFTVTSSSTTARSLTIQNTSDTASSEAAEIISVAGTSAGDPYSKYVLSSTAEYALGIDNSDSDIFKINYASSDPTPSSGTNCMLFYSGGNVQHVNNTMFRVYVGSDQNNVTGDNSPATTYKIQFGTENFDVGSHFDSSTNYVFTAPVDGIYIFGGMCRVGGVGDQDEGSLKLRVNGSDVIVYILNWNSLKDANSQSSSYLNIIYELAANDTVSLEIELSGGSATSNTVDVLGGSNLTYFFGALVG